MEKPEKKWDAFISHAAEDQESFVRNLAQMLTRLGLSIWYAETALRVGDSLTQLERFFTAKIARIEAPASEDAGKPMAGKVSPFQLVE